MWAGDPSDSKTRVGFASCFLVRMLMLNNSVTTGMSYFAFSYWLQLVGATGNVVTHAGGGVRHFRVDVH